jgi:beta-alanine--pyruvate transaminase
MAAIELAPRAEGPGRRGYDVMVDCFRSGLLVRAAGDAIALSPPLIAEPQHFEEMAAILGEAIKRAS